MENYVRPWPVRASHDSDIQPLLKDVYQGNCGWSGKGIESGNNTFLAAADREAIGGKNV